MGTGTGGKRHRKRGSLTAKFSPLKAAPAPLPSSSPSTPLLMKMEAIIGGMDTNEELSDSCWYRVKYYARLVIERVEHGVNAGLNLYKALYY
jgi:hypothetical protein